MSLLRASLLVVVVLALSSVAMAASRTWTDVHGKVTTGKFVRYFDGDVIIQRGARVVTIPFDELSGEDQDYVRSELEKKGEADKLPAEVVVTLPSTDEERTWTSNDGKQIQAQLISTCGRNVTLRVKGREVTIRLSRLSVADQQYVKARMAKPEGGANPSHMPPINPQPIGGPPPRPEHPPFPTPSMPSPQPGGLPGMPGSPSQRPDSPRPPEPAQRPSGAPQFPTFPSPAMPRPSTRPVTPGSSGLPFPHMTPPCTPQTRMTKYCCQCKREVPDSTKVGDKCPYCGVYFAYEQDANGKVVAWDPSELARSVKVWAVPVGILVISLITWCVRRK
jgi:hypothetical protein